MAFAAGLFGVGLGGCGALPIGTASSASPNETLESASTSFSVPQRTTPSALASANAAAQPEAIASASQDHAPPAPPPNLASLPDPVVTSVPKSPRGNRPYVVWGKRYTVLDSAEGYDSTGTASWYGTKFNGRETSSGEVYDMFDLTAAHRSLPLPSFVRVTNLGNGKSTVVRVNDRGPFHPQRIIDLSYAAAVKLGFHEQGVAPVRVQTVAPQVEPAMLDEPMFVRAGRFERYRDADAACDQLAPMVSTDAYVIRAHGAFTVRIGPLETPRDAERLTALLAFQERAPVTVEE